MYRINAAWQNWPGAPGVTTFFQDPAIGQPNPAAIRAFFNAIAAYLPNGATIQVPSSGDLIEEADGKISGTWSSTPAPAVVTAGGLGSYAGNAGAVVHWLTSTIAKGRRVRGRSFLVPIVGSQYESNGSLQPTCITGIENAATALMNATPGHLLVWHRPTYQKPATKPPTMLSPGSKAAVTGIRVPDLSVSLRSRRV